MPLFAGIDGVRFRRVVRPGDVLDFELIVDRLRRTFGRGTGIVHCNGETVLDATAVVRVHRCLKAARARARASGAV